jgi:hypothetical protein
VRKSDVRFHTLGYPAVNVKVPYQDQGEWRELAVKAATDDGASTEEAEAYAEWFMADDRAEDSGWFSIACQDGWERLQEYAEEIFSDGMPHPKLKVWSEGRSGGWAYIEGLPDFDSWDAIMVSKWFKFVKWARQEADDIPYQVVSLIYINVFESAYDQKMPERRMLVGAGVGL